MKFYLITSAVLAIGTVLAAQTPQQSAAPSRLGAGYLKPGAGPNSGKLLPPPPAEGSKALARDREGEAAALKLQGTARWDQARVDAEIFGPDGIDVFSCAAGRKLGPAETPKINALLRNAVSDLGLSSYPAKTIYKRPRPFLGNGKPVCTPDQGGVLAMDGSYPSGHSAIGYGWGLILADVLPHRKAKFIKRSAVFGDSRRVCNVHFISDVEAGQTLARAVVDKLRANDAFMADLAAAKAEARTAKPIATSCAVEKAAFAIR